MYHVQLTDSLFPAVTEPPIWEISVGEQLRKTAVAHPNAEALVEITQANEVGRRFTYTELLAQSERLALSLASHFAKGERVCVWSPNSPEWVLMEYACALAGLVLVTANPAFQPKELRYVLEQSGAVALFHVQGYRGNPMAAIAAAALEGNAQVRRVVDMDDHTALFAQGANAAALPEVSAGDPIQIQYTSGTTGFPKGAVLSHRGLLNNARFYADRLGVTQASTWANPMPMFHTSSCGMITLGTMQAGARMVLISLFDAGALNRLIAAEQITIMLGVPTMVQAMLEAHQQTASDLSSLTMVASGGSMVAPELVRRAYDVIGCDFNTIYGQTEHSPVIIPGVIENPNLMA